MSPSLPFGPLSFWPKAVALCDAPKAAPAAGGGKEPATGIEFPNMVDGLVFVGAGVRVKYGFVKVRPGTFKDPTIQLAADNGQRRGETRYGAHSLAICWQSLVVARLSSFGC